MAKLPINLGYYNVEGGITYSVYDIGNQTWNVESGRLIVLREEPSAELLTWLQANATRYFADEVGK